MKKLGLVLGAGGSRGVAHIGFLNALDEAGIKPQIITGCSMGSLIGGCYAVGIKPERMKKEITKLKMSELLDLSINPFGNVALLRSKKVYKKLSHYFKDTTFEQLKIPFNCVAVDMISGETVKFNKEEKVLDGVMASCCIPGLFKPVERGEQRLIDGNVKCRLPIEVAEEMGADVTVAVDVLGEVRNNNKKYNLFSAMLRTADIYEAELSRYRLLAHPPTLYFNVDLGDMNQYKFKGIPEAIEIGYELGKENIKKIKKILED
ncbi:MAG: patatin-like phospholipase family protein [Clostridia bacterium]|nr:patatin-like phospholipase family protein [Clostridia bacterium]